MHTVNDQLINVDVYLKTKDFKWALILVAHLIGPGHLLKKIKNQK